MPIGQGAGLLTSLRSNSTNVLRPRRSKQQGLSIADLSNSCSHPRRLWIQVEGCALPRALAKRSRSAKVWEDWPIGQFTVSPN